MAFTEVSLAQDNWKAACAATDANDEAALLIACSPHSPGEKAFVEEWTGALQICATKGHVALKESSWHNTMLKRRADGDQGYFYFFGCEVVINIAQKFKVIDVEHIAAAAAGYERVLEEEQRQYEERQAERNRTPEEREAALEGQYPDTYNVLRVASGFNSVARAIETRNVGPLGSTVGYIFMGGVVDALILCPVNISSPERARLAAVAANAVMKVRNYGFGDLDQIARLTADATGFYKDGFAAGEALKCAEPAATKLLQNVLSMLQ